MRTIHCLDQSVAKFLRKRIRRFGCSLKAAVKHFLRMGLAISGRPPGERFVVKARPLGLPAGLSYDNLEELLEVLEKSG